MFSRLYVKNYVLIDSLDIEFPKGLVIITGQTGAGKSILIGSISLLLGAKADPSVIGESGDNCIVEAEFENPDPGIEPLVDGCGAEWDPERLVLRRVVSRSGRSRCFVNDCPSAIPAISSISSALIDIHSQHQTLLLSDKSFRLSALDHFAGNEALRDRMGGAYSSYVKSKAELEAIEAKIKALEAENDYNAARFEKLDSAALREGELEELEAEQNKLANAEEIKENLFAVEDTFSPDSDGRPTLDEMLRESERHLAKASAYVPQADGLRERIGAARIELDDILSDVKRINSGVELSSGRLAEVEERISKIYALLHNFSCSAVSELIALRDELAGVLHDSGGLVAKRDELARTVAESLALAQTLAGELHQARKHAAQAMGSALEESLHFLELQGAVFRVGLIETPLCPTGTDTVTFEFSASGKNPVDVSKCASGGEMSRIMLCLKDMMARHTNMPTMIFDEIDTGVSGSTADKIGSMICSMGENMQVFAITHLPQVAAKGQAHYLVSKSVERDTSKSVTTIEKLSGRDRVLEIARMLSGSSVTPAAVANAESLLGQ